MINQADQLNGNPNFTIRNNNMAHELGSIAHVRQGNLDPRSVSFINPVNHREIASRLQTLNGNRFNLHDSEDLTRYRNLLTAAGNATQDDMSAWRELSDYRVFELNYDIMASPWALAAFQIVNLQADELPMIDIPRSRNLQRFTVHSMSIDGQTTSNQWITAREIVQIEMEMLATEKMRYRLWDLQQGDVNQSQSIERELRYDIDMNVDALGLANLNANLVTSGLRDVLKLHPNIIAANIPDKNYLDLTASDAGKLTVAKLRTILTHIAQFGSAGSVDEQFQISNIQISPQNISDPWEFVSLVSGYDSSDANQDQPKNTVPSSVRDSIYNTGMFTSAWGYNFSWTPNPQLNKGKMYVFTNKPVGWVFLKPELDRMLTWDDRTHPDFAERNYGEMMFRKAIKIYMPDLWRQRYLVVDF
jgi:hypothetical protein